MREVGRIMPVAVILGFDEESTDIIEQVFKRLMERKFVSYNPIKCNFSSCSLINCLFYFQNILLVRNRVNLHF